jgi:hypothetical protein
MDVEPHPDGNMVIHLGLAKRRTEETDALGLAARKSHFATCPQADIWRSR